MNRSDAEQFSGLLHFRFDKVYCLPKSVTGHYFRVESNATYGTPYFATYDNRESATRFAALLSNHDKRDASVLHLNI